jgi:hypothetical protein
MQGMEDQMRKFAGHASRENLSQRPPTDGMDGLMDPLPLPVRIREEDSPARYR